MSHISRQDCINMDNSDALNSFRAKFALPDNTCYLNGNSLGVRPVAAAARAQEVVEQEWGVDLIRSWNTNNWITLPQRLGGKISTIVGAQADEVLVADSTSVNLFKLAAAAVKLNPGRRKIISEPGNFPTDLYMLQGLERFLDDKVELVVCSVDEMAAAIDEDTALVVLTHVHYKTGRMLDMPAITAQAQSKGALMLWDLSHSAGAVPVDLNAANADLAIGCGYKYLNGGPGAPAFLYVAKRHQAKLEQPLSGWFGHANPFAMQDDYQPAPGIERTLCGTTSVIAASVLEVGIDIMASADMSLIREKSVAMADLFIALVESRCAEYGFTLVSPKDANIRGSQISLTHPHGFAIMQALIARNIIGDFRAPDILRFGFTPLYLRYVDIWDCVDALADIMQNDSWKDPAFNKLTAVT